MVHRLSRLGRDDGAVALMTVIFISAVFIGLLALVVDLGLARDTRRQAQNAADASALAAGNGLYLTNGSVNITVGSDLAGGTSAISVAKSYAASNYGVTEAEWSACLPEASPPQLPYYPNTACISFDSPTNPRTVRVRVPIRQVKTPFAQIWGVSTVPVSAAAKIQVDGGLAQCGLCVIGSGSHVLGNGKITVSGANVAINGALDVNGGQIKVDSGFNINVHNSPTGSGIYVPTGALRPNQPEVADPLASLTLPVFSSLIRKTNSCTDGEGIYEKLEAPCAMMKSGLYVLTGETKVTSKYDVVGAGVTLYFVCANASGGPRPCNNLGEVGGSLAFTGSGTLNITAPTSPPNKGLSIIADRNNSAVFVFGGSGTQNSSGTIYLPKATLSYNGNGTAYITDSLIVVGDFNFNGGNTALNSTYTQTANAERPVSDLHLSE